MQSSRRRLFPQNRAVGLARSEQAPATPSAEEQGAERVADDARVAGDPAGCANGETQGGSGRLMTSASSLEWPQCRARNEANLRRTLPCSRREQGSMPAGADVLATDELEGCERRLR
jgi:hypothetical protein